MCVCVENPQNTIQIQISILIFTHVLWGSGLNDRSTGGHLCNFTSWVVAVVTWQGQSSGLGSGRDVWLWTGATVAETHSSAFFPEQTDTIAAWLQLLIDVSLLTP